MDIIVNVQDGLISIQPQDKDGGPTTIPDLSVLQLMSSDETAFAKPVLDPPDQTDPGRVSYTARVLSVGTVGAKATISTKIGDIALNDVDFTIVSPGPPPPNPVAGGQVIAAAVNKA